MKRITWRQTFLQAIAMVTTFICLYVFIIKKNVGGQNFIKSYCVGMHKSSQFLYGLKDLLPGNRSLEWIGLLMSQRKGWRDIYVDQSTLTASSSSLVRSGLEAISAACLLRFSWSSFSRSCSQASFLRCSSARSSFSTFRAASFCSSSCRILISSFARSFNKHNNQGHLSNAAASQLKIP